MLKITTEYTVWCNICGDWKQKSAPKSKAIKEFVKMGWKYIRKVGYVCPNCLANRIIV
jgi:hypothetical protein